MNFDLEIYRRAEANNGPEFSLQYLENAMEIVSEREREDRRSKEISQAVAKGGQTSQQPASAANAKAKTKAAAKAEKAKAKAAAKAAEAAAKAAQALAAAKVEPPPLSAFTKADCIKRGFCSAFQTGQCKLGDKCKYKHDKGKSRERGRSQSPGNRRGSRGDRRTRSASPANDRDVSKVPCRFFARGKCTRDNCPFLHAPDSRGNTPPASPRSQGAASEQPQRAATE